MLTEKIQLESDEVTLAVVRKHWFVLFLQIFGIAIGAFFPFVAYLFITNLSLTVLRELNLVMSTPFLGGLYAGWLVVLWMALFNIWTNYYLDVWTVTNKRLITVDQRGLFNRDTGSFRLERLQDINVSVRGILATLLKYGDLEAETASSDKTFTARSIPNPQELKALILKASDGITFAQKPVLDGVTASSPQQINDGL